MGMLKHYILELVHLCSDETFGQDAVEWAIRTGLIRLTYRKHEDLRVIVGEPGKPDSGRYSEILEAYRQLLCKE
jgi:hypothetical protein